LLNHLAPGLGALGLGGLLGYGVAIAFRSAARTLGCMLGLLFILLQVLAYYKIVTVDWGSLAHQAAPAGHAAEAAGQRLWHILTYNLPFAGGFAGGFLLGMRRV
jgi:uncharacterized membrane protein (Fun14 family)